MKPVFFETQFEFRKWFELNHQTETELIVGFYKVKSGKLSIEMNAMAYSLDFRFNRNKTPRIFAGTSRVLRSPRGISSQNSANAEMALSNRVVC